MLTPSDGHGTKMIQASAGGWDPVRVSTGGRVSDPFLLYANPILLTKNLSNAHQCS